MKLDQLRSFLAVAKHLSLRYACSELRLTQPAISKRLTTLQRELGTKLYQRRGRGIELTDAGRVAAIRLAPILKQIDDLITSLRGKIPQKQQPVVLSIAAAYSIVANQLPPIIARFTKLHANVDVQCQTGSSQQIQQLLREGRAEIGLSTYRSLSTEIAAEPFRIQSLVFL